MGADVFISFSNKDKDLAERMRQTLEDSGISCWMSSRDISAGAEYADVIDDAIVNSKSFVVLFSQNSSASKWVRCELSVAFDEDVAIFPYRIDNTKLTGSMRMILNDKHWIDASHNPESKFDELSKTIIKHINSESIDNQNDKCDDDDNSESSKKPQNGKKLFSFASLLLLAFIGIIFLLKTTALKSDDDEMEPLVFNVDGVEFTMIPVKGSTFVMGSHDGTQFFMDREVPAHNVTLSDYYIGKHEVTVELYRLFIEKSHYQPNEFESSNGSVYDGVYKFNQTEGVNWECDVNGAKRDSTEDNHPVVFISWHNATAFCKWLSEETGHDFRLPTEAEWEFAAIGGVMSHDYDFSGSNNVDEVAWYQANSDSKTHPVGTKEPNELGIYDMSGNAYEWCQDWYGDYVGDNQINPQGAEKSLYRSRRGGRWNGGYLDCRVRSRSFMVDNYNYPDVGFRIALSK